MIDRVMSGLDEKGLRAAIFPNGENPLWTDMQRGAVDETISRVVRYLASATPADVGELVERLREKANKLDDMQGFSAPSGKLEREAATALERVVRERDNLQARLTARAKSMLRLREALAGVHDNIEDEGDRTYFGSTNDADTFREVWQDLDAWAWDDIMSDGKMTDVYAASRKAHTRAEVAEAKLAEARKVIEPFARAADNAERLAGHDGPLGQCVELEHLRAARRFIEETK